MNTSPVNIPASVQLSGPDAVISLSTGHWARVDGRMHGPWPLRQYALAGLATEQARTRRKARTLQGGIEAVLHRAVMGALAIVAFLAWGTSADAQQYRETCTRHNGTMQCTYGEIRLQAPNAKIIHIEQGMIDEEKRQRWIEECKPEIVTDNFGVGRYVYALPGCEYGARPGSRQVVR